METMSLLEKLCHREEASGAAGRYALHYGLLGDMEGWVIDLYPWQEGMETLHMVVQNYAKAKEIFDKFTKDHRGRLAF